MAPALALDNEARGVLPAQCLGELIASGAIRADVPIGDDQVQPASLDLRLGARAHRLPFSFLPGQGATVREKLDQYSMHSFAIETGAVLEKGCVYLVELEESVSLPDRLDGIANPKSSTGRLDVFARVITDGAATFDRVAAGYSGPLYAEIAPRTFSIKVTRGSRLAQLRLRQRNHPLGLGELKALHAKSPIADSRAPAFSEHGLPIRLETRPLGADEIIGYRARKHAGLIDIDRVAAYPREAFWEPVAARPGGGLVLDPDDFYILVSKERVAVPPDCAAEMVAYDTLVGEFRVHYAGFFDPGFGHGHGGTRAVLEVRSHEVPFLVDDGQIVGHLRYDRLTAPPDRLYGAKLGSNYTKQDLNLSKHFLP
ncbi:MAG: 2'-deoxycytidine 5'-triphosphate deaminase [Geminicoccaceae bacterium]